MRWRALSIGTCVVACTFDLPRPNDATPAPGDASCKAAPMSASPVVLVDFESGAVPSPSTSPVGFEAAGSVAQPGANGTANAGVFPFQQSIFVDGHVRAQYFATASGKYDATAANALELYLKIPAGSPALRGTGDATLSVLHYEMRPGDPWIGPNPGANLPDSEMRGHAGFRVDPSAADRWIRVVLAPGAIGTRSQYYHLYAARSLTEDLAPYAALRGFALEPRVATTAADTIALDEIRLVSLAPTAVACPDFTRSTVSASGGDVEVPIVLANPGPSARRYRAFVSSTLGVDRQALEVAVHDIDDTAAADTLQGAVGAEGGIGAVELFATDDAGKRVGPSITVAGGDGISVAAGAAWRGVVVHHVRPEMLGPVVPVAVRAVTYDVRRDTLTTSLLFWDPDEPRLSDPSVTLVNDAPEASHPPAPGFTAAAPLPAGWGSADIPMDQVGGAYVSILSLTP